MIVSSAAELLGIAAFDDDAVLHKTDSAETRKIRP